MTGYTKKWYDEYMSKRRQSFPAQNRHVEGKDTPEPEKIHHTPQIQCLWIPGCLPGMNEIIDTARTHWAKSAEQKQNYTDLVASYCVLNRLKPMKRVWLSITYHEKNQRRDPDNIAAGKKFILDGLVQAGVLANDGHAQVAGFDESFCFDGREGVEVVLSECL